MSCISKSHYRAFVKITENSTQRTRAKRESFGLCNWKSLRGSSVFKHSGMEKLKQCHQDLICLPQTGFFYVVAKVIITSFQAEVPWRQRASLLIAPREITRPRLSAQLETIPEARGNAVQFLVQFWACTFPWSLRSTQYARTKSGEEVKCCNGWLLLGEGEKDIENPHLQLV